MNPTYNSNSNYYIPPFRIPQAPSLSSSDQQPQQYQQQSQQQFFRLPPSSSYQIQNSQPDFQPPPYLHPLVLPFSNGLPSSDRYNLNHNYSQNQRGFGGMMQPSFEFARRGKGGGGSDGRFIELEKLEDTKPLVPVVTSNSIPSTSTANSSIDITPPSLPAPVTTSVSSFKPSSLPSAGDSFPSIEAFKLACKSSGTTFTQTRPISQSSCAVECTKSRNYGCKARIVIKYRSDNAGGGRKRWYVDEEMTRLIHTNHEMTLNHRKILEENIKNQKELDKLTMPQVNQIYPSKLALQTALSYASHKLGFKTRITQPPRPSRIVQSIVLGCDHSASQGNSKNLGKNCPFLLRATKIDKEGRYQVTQFISGHNHEGVDVGVWRRPVVKAVKVEEEHVSSRRARSGDGKFKEEEDSGYEDENYDMLDSDNEEKVPIKIEAGPSNSHSNSKRQRRSISQSSQFLVDRSSPLPTTSTSSIKYEPLDVKPLVHLPTPSTFTPSPSPLQILDAPTSKTSYRKITLKELQAFLFHLSPILVNITSALYSAGINNNLSLMNLISIPTRKEFDEWWEALEKKENNEGRKLSPVARAVLKGKIEAITR